jgi:hypothetical protein
LTTDAAQQVRELSGAEYDRRLEGLLELVRAELNELNRRHDRDRLLLARAFEVQRQEDWKMHVAAFDTLARGVGRQSRQQQEMLQHIWERIEAGELISPSHVKPLRKDQNDEDPYPRQY